MRLVCWYEMKSKCRYWCNIIIGIVLLINDHGLRVIIQLPFLIASGKWYDVGFVGVDDHLQAQIEVELKVWTLNLSWSFKFNFRADLIESRPSWLVFDHKR